MRASFRGWLLAAFVVAVLPGACTFLSDFPDVESDETFTSASGTGGAGATSTGDSSAESGASSSASTASGVCAISHCSGVACDTDDVASRVRFATADVGTGARPTGLVTVGADAYVSVTYQSPLTINGASQMSIDPGPELGSSLVYRVSGVQQTVARTYECHVANGGYDAKRLVADALLVQGVTTAAPADSVPNIQVDRAPDGQDCAGFAGQARDASSRVPFLTAYTVDSPGSRFVLPADDTIMGAELGVHAVYLATATRGTKVAMLGVTPSGARLFGVDMPCSAGPACHFVIDYDLADPGNVVIHVEPLPTWGEGGVFPGVDAPAAITFDEVGDLWATSTERHDKTTPPELPIDQEIVVYHRQGVQPGILRRSSVFPTARATAIAAHGGRVYVAGDVDGTLTFNQQSRAGTVGRRDLYVMAFDAQALRSQAAPSPEWIRPTSSQDAGFDMSLASVASDLAILDSAGCEPAIYVAGCSSSSAAGGCVENEGSLGLLLRLTPDGSIPRTTILSPVAGGIRGADLAIDQGRQSVWISIGFEGEALGFTSPAADRPTTVVTRFPL